MLQEKIKNKPNKSGRPRPKFFTLGLGKEQGYFFDNLSMLVDAGMPILGALDVLTKEMRSLRMKRIFVFMRGEIESGSPIWAALQKINLFPEHTISLLRLGEESGKLADNLKVVAIEQEKNRMFRSKILSAMMYPVFVLALMVIISIGFAWFILPRLVTQFSQMGIPLPIFTKILIDIGIFLGKYGQLVVPSAIVIIIVLFYFIFSFSKTKIIGQFILLSLPSIKQLIKEVELARLGYLLGTLLDAGIPITQALNSLASATEISQYRKLYKHLSVSIEEGNSFQKSFISFKRISNLIPESIQQLIVAGEQSGSLSRTLLKINQVYEDKSTITTKNLAVILEPIVLVIVGIGVLAVSLAIILPMYSLMSGLR